MAKNVGDMSKSSRDQLADNMERNGENYRKQDGELGELQGIELT
jgi:hypothetical protein